MNREDIKNILDRSNVSAKNEIEILEIIDALTNSEEEALERASEYAHTIMDLQNIIDKAIEYIKQYGNLYCLKHKQFKDYQQYKELLDILRGNNE